MGFGPGDNVKTCMYFPAVIGGTSVHRRNFYLRDEYMRKEMGVEEENNNKEKNRSCSHN